MLTHFQPASICCPARNITLYLQSNIRVTINAKKGENTKVMFISREYCVIHFTYLGGIVFLKYIYTVAVVIKIPICYQTSSTMGYLTSFRTSLHCKEKTPKFRHSCVCERFLYSQDRSAYSFGGNI